MKLLIFLSLVVGAFCSSIDWRIINQINSGKATWRAGPNPVAQKGDDYVKRMLGAVIPTNKNQIPRYVPAQINSVIPESFDSREQWPNCVSIQSIKDQSDCGSCWAVAGASAMSDRICVASHGNIQLNISAQNLVSCCHSCGDGCNGGDPRQAWQFFQSEGLVTGGDYGSNEGCEPYLIEPCNNDPSMGEPKCPEQPPSTPNCYDSSCYNKQYTIPYQQDKHYGKSAFLLESSVKTIQQELMQNGPVEAAFNVYQDFMYYKSGVYQHVTGSFLGGHAVRVLGWGVEDGTPFWLVANSWNRHWGLDGTFKIIRGQDECGFEDYVVAGIPKI